jgi:hypothetical protein
MGALAELILPAVVVYTTLFGLLARGNPRPGGIALFWRVALVGLALGGLMWLLTVRFGAGVNLPRFVRMSYRGLVLGGLALAIFAAAGNALQRKR